MRALHKYAIIVLIATAVADRPMGAANNTTRVRATTQRFVQFARNHKKKLIAGAALVGLHFFLKYRHAKKIAASEAAVKNLQDADFAHQTNEFARSLALVGYRPVAPATHPFMEQVDQEEKVIWENLAPLLDLDLEIMTDAEVEPNYLKLKAEVGQQKTDPATVADKRTFMREVIENWRSQRDEWRRNLKYYSRYPHAGIIVFFNYFAAQNFNATAAQCREQCNSLKMQLRWLLDNDKYFAQETGQIVGDTLATNSYAVLGVAPGASQAEIRKAHRRLALQHHPDRNGNSARFMEIDTAYKNLTDPKNQDFTNLLKMAHGGPKAQGGEENIIAELDRLIKLTDKKD